MGMKFITVSFSTDSTRLYVAVDRLIHGVSYVKGVLNQWRCGNGADTPDIWAIGKLS